MKPIHRFRLISLAAALTLASTCNWAQTAPSGKAHSPSNDATADETSDDGHLFYEVLLGEVTTRSGDPGAGYALILDAARRGHSAQLYQRAADIALQSRSGEFALTAAKAWQEDFPKSREANRYVLQILIALNQVAESVIPLRQFVTQAPAPSKVAILNAVPQMYARASDKKAAADAVQEALQLETTHPSTGAVTWVVFGRMRLAAGDRSGAVDTLKKAQALDPAYDGLARLALELLDEGSREAKPFVTQFLERQPAPDIRMLYARVLLAQANFTEALAQLTRVTQDKPDMTEAWLVLASLQAQDQKPSLATASLQKFFELAQTQGDGNANQRVMTQAYLLAAQIAEKQGDLKTAQQWLDRIESPNDSFSVQRQRAAILAKQGQMTDARALLQALPASNADDQRMKLLAEVQLLKDNNQNEEAFQLQSKALEASPDDNELAYDQAMLAEKTGRLDLMEQLLRQVIARQPDYHHAYNALGYSLADRGIRLDEAKSLIQKALDLAPGDPFITDSLAWAEFRLGNIGRATQLLESAFAQKADAEIAAHLGEVLWTQGHKDKAMAVWKEGLRLNRDNQTLKDTLKRLGVTL